MEKPWIEKYRPSKITNLITNDNIRNQINIIINSSECKHLILSGLPGIGKTSCVKCIAHEILGEYVNNMLLEINPTEENYMKNISSTLNTFCKRIETNPDLNKIVILDEADLLTSKSQNEILGKIKEYGENVHFFFTCNDSTKIIENIQSISRIIHFPLLTKDQIVSVLDKICVEESIKYDLDALVTLYEISQGDLRKAINNLQIVSVNGKVTNKNIYRICSFPDPDEIREIIDKCKNKDTIEMKKGVDTLLLKGYNNQDILNCFNKVFNDMFYTSTPTKNNKIDIKYAELVHKTKVSTINLKSKLQLYNFVFQISKYLNS